MKYLVGLDVGTSNVKAVLFDTEGNELKASVHETVVMTSNKYYSEQDMMQVWEQCAGAIKDVVTCGIASPDDILGIGFSGQGEGCWMIDKDGNPVQYASLWNDGRANELIPGLSEEQVKTFRLACTAPNPSATVLQLMWMKKNRPEAIEKAETCFFAKDWIRFKLTGEKYIDYTDASTSPLDVKEGKISEKIFEDFGIADCLRLFPPLRYSTDCGGYITEEASKITGLKVGTPCAMGALDVTITMAGVNAVNEGDVYTILGTTCCNGIVVDLNKVDLYDGGCYMHHPKKGLGIDIAATMAGTPNLDWMLDEIAGTHDFGEIEKMIKDIPAGSEGVIYHPYITPSGERSPFYNPNARAGFLGLSTLATRAHMIKAVYEGIAYSIKDCLYGKDVSGRIYAAGGGSKSLLWAQIIADVTGCEVVLSEGTEFGAKGAAMLAGVCAGIYSDINEAAGQLCKVKCTFKPNLENTKIYDELFKVFRASRIANMEIWNMRQAALDKIEK